MVNNTTNINKQTIKVMVNNTTNINKQTIKRIVNNTTNINLFIVCLLILVVLLTITFYCLFINIGGIVNHHFLLFVY
jgi:hypothetical protein